MCDKKDPKNRTYYNLFGGYKKNDIFGLKNNLTRNHITVWKQNYLHFLPLFYVLFLLPYSDATYFDTFVFIFENNLKIHIVLAINRMTHLDVSYWNITISHT